MSGKAPIRGECWDCGTEAIVHGMLCVEPYCYHVQCIPHAIKSHGVCSACIDDKFDEMRSRLMHPSTYLVTS